MKSNISKHFAAKAKQGLRFANGLVQDQMVEGAPNNAPWTPSAGQSALLSSYDARMGAANQPTAPVSGGLTQGEQSSLAIQSDMNNLGTVNPTPGLGQGAQHNFFNKSMSDLQSGNQPYTPGSANDPHASASIGPKGPTRLPQASPSRTQLRQWQEPAFADGVVPETADQLMARMTAKYGAPSAGTRAPEPAPTPAPQPVQQAPQPKPQTGGLFGQALRGLRGANDELRKAANYKDGMVHEGPGIVDGPGGPREDKVDAKLSDGEAVLPEATVAALGGPEEVAELIQRTNGKEPARGLRSGVHASTGVVGDMINPNDLRPEFRSAAQTPVIKPAANAGLEVARDGRAVAAQARTAQPQGFYEKMGRLSAAETPKPTAAPTVAKAAGLAGGALGYLGPIANGVGIGTMIAHAVDSIPSLRGRATAEASNMELAGTPQHEEEVNKALVAQDAAWAQRHGKTLTDAQRTQPLNQPVVAAPKAPAVSIDKEEAMRDDGMAAALGASGKIDPAIAKMNGTLRKNLSMADNQAMPEGLRMGNSGGVPMTSWNSKTNEADANMGRNKGLAADDSKIVSIKQKDGGFRNVVLGDAEYTAADGSKTTDWKKTAQFAEGTAQAAKDKDRLREVQMQNAKFNATSDQITDPRARAAGLRGLAQYDVEEKNRTETAKNAASAESARIGHLLTERGQNITIAGHNAMQGNTDRAFKSEQDAKVAKRVKDSLDIAAPTEGLKDDDLKVAKANRADLEQALYAAHKKMPSSEAEYAAEAPSMLNQAKLSVAMRNAVKNAPWYNRLGNAGHTMWESLHALTPVRQGDNFVFEGGYTVPVKSVIGNDADLNAAYEARLKQSASK